MTVSASTTTPQLRKRSIPIRIIRLLGLAFIENNGMLFRGPSELAEHGFSIDQPSPALASKK